MLVLVASREFFNGKKEGKDVGKWSHYEEGHWRFVRARKEEQVIVTESITFSFDSHQKRERRGVHHSFWVILRA